MAPKLYIEELDIGGGDLVVTFHATQPVFVGLQDTPLSFAAVSLKAVHALPQQLGLC